MDTELSEEAEMAMETALNDMRDRLRLADELDVEGALAGSVIEEALRAIGVKALLHFWERMLDERIGP